MQDLINDAKEELKRVDHLIYVSLKYTRTVDVILNVIERLISSYDFVSQALLKRMADKGKLETIPVAPKLRCEELERLYSDDEQILVSVRQYLLLRQIARSEYEKESEYRRHVAMVTRIEGQEVRMDIDEVTVQYKKARDLIEYIEATYND